MSFRLRLTAIFSLGAVVVVALGGWLYLTRLGNGLRDATDASLRSRAVLLRGATAQLSAGQGQTAPPSSSDAGGLLTQVLRPDGAVVQESPSLHAAHLLTASELATVQAGHAVLVTRETDGDISYRVLAEPVQRPDGTWTAIVVAPTEEIREAIGSLQHSLLVAGALIVVLAAAGGWLLASASLRAVDRMRSSVELITTADLSKRVEVPPGHDELAALGATFNALLDRLSFALAQQRRFVADAGHELRGPLAVLRMEFELADRPQRNRDELAAAIHAAGEEVDRLARLANDLLFLSRSDDGELQVDKKVAPIGPVVRTAVEARALAAKARGVELRVEVPDGLRADFDADRLRHAVDNLLDNALQATDPGGQVAITVEQLDSSTVVSVTDTGPGFPPDFLPVAFERFSRPDASRTESAGGTGLGLAIVQAVALAHGGSAVASNLADGGARVAITIPAPQHSLREIQESQRGS